MTRAWFQMTHSVQARSLMVLKPLRVRPDGPLLIMSKGVRIDGSRGQSGAYPSDVRTHSLGGYTRVDRRSASRCCLHLQRSAQPLRPLAHRAQPKVAGEVA